jgi:hypothetical protein
MKKNNFTIFDLNINCNNVFKELNLKDIDILRIFRDIYLEMRYDPYFEINVELEDLIIHTIR